MTRVSVALIAGSMMTAIFGVAHSASGSALDDYMRYECVAAEFDGRAADDDHVRIVNTVGVAQPHWSEVFIADTSESNDDPWGLSCFNTWRKTGCYLASPDDDNDDWDLWDEANGCRSNDPEFEDEMVMTVNCCRLAIGQD